MHDPSQKRAPGIIQAFLKDLFDVFETPAEVCTIYEIEGSLTHSGISAEPGEKVIDCVVRPLIAA